jgi:opacity protein-like surface antigen
VRHAGAPLVGDPISGIDRSEKERANVMRIVRTWVRRAGTGLLAVAAGAALATPAHAQQIEASVFYGYTLSEGIDASQSRVILGGIYNSLDITSSSAWGFTAGGFVGENVELEFLYAQQMSRLEISDPSPSLEFADMNVNSYQGNIVYNWGEGHARVRPFMFFGLGATHYAGGDVDGHAFPGVGGQIRSETKFATNWGAGVKFYPAPSIGIKGMARYTPTFVKSDPGGLWCDPFYPTCWVVNDLDYSNQFEMSVGVTFRFGGR